MTRQEMTKVRVIDQTIAKNITVKEVSHLLTNGYCFAPARALSIALSITILL